MSRLILVAACALILGAHVGAYFLMETQAPLATVVYLGSWAIFIWLMVQANKVNPRRRLPKPNAAPPAAGEEPS
jgi:hypothetical protein